VARRNPNKATPAASPGSKDAPGAPPADGAADAMPTSILATLGKITGVGGIALGVLLTLFRTVITESLPHVERADAARILQVTLLFTFAITIVGLVIWASQVKMAKGMLAGLLVFATAVTVAGWTVMRPEAPGTYQLRVTVLSPQRAPVDDARVTTNVGGEASRVNGGWQFEIPVAKLPRSREVKVFAEHPASFTRGTATVTFDEQHSLATEVVLAKEANAQVRGIVVDKAGRAVSDVHVSIVGAGDEGVVTHADGGFVLNAHVAEGEMARVHAEKGRLAVNQDQPAGGIPMTILLR